MGSEKISQVSPRAGLTALEGGNTQGKARDPLTGQDGGGRAEPGKEKEREACVCPVKLCSL